MDSWEWPREFWDLTPPWEADDFDVIEEDYVPSAQRYTEDEWEPSDPKRMIVSLEELEDLEEEALWEEEFDLDDPTHLYLYMDEYEYLQQFKQPELRELLEEEEVWADDAPEAPIQGPAADDRSDGPPSGQGSPGPNQPPHEDEDTPR